MAFPYGLARAADSIRCCRRSSRRFVRRHRSCSRRRRAPARRPACRARCSRRASARGANRRPPAAPARDAPRRRSAWPRSSASASARRSATRSASRTSSGPKTRLRFVTEGVLGRRLLSDPQLRGVGAVVLDEFHERHLARRHRARAAARGCSWSARPDLKLVVMSATLDAEPIARVPGRRAAPRAPRVGASTSRSSTCAAAPTSARWTSRCLAALKRLVAARASTGDVLVFLPGAGEIRRAQRDLRGRSPQRHGLRGARRCTATCPPAEQDRAVRRLAERKVILSTNVAETSVTIDGVAAVIDSGLARVASHSPWSGLPALKRGEGQQGVGDPARRARRPNPRGRVPAALHEARLRHARPEHDAPEIRRAGSRGDGARPARQRRPGPRRVPLLRGPARGLARGGGRAAAPAGRGGLPRAASRRSASGCCVSRSTPPGPADRRGRAARRRRRRRDVAALARRAGHPPWSAGPARRDFRASASQVVAGPSDLLEMLERFRKAERAQFAPPRLSSLSLDVGATQAVDRVRKQLSRGARSSRGLRPQAREAVEQAIGALRARGLPGPRGPASPAALARAGAQRRRLGQPVGVQRRPGLGPDGGGGRGGAHADAAARRSWCASPAEWRPSGSSSSSRRISARRTCTSSTRTRSGSSASSGWPTGPRSSRRPARRHPRPRRPRARWRRRRSPRAWRSSSRQRRWSSVFGRIELLARHYPDAGFRPPDEAWLRSALQGLCEGARNFATSAGPTCSSRSRTTSRPSSRSSGAR